jgi:hypothetical protein
VYLAKGAFRGRVTASVSRLTSIQFTVTATNRHTGHVVSTGVAVGSTKVSTWAHMHRLQTSPQQQHVHMLADALSRTGLRLMSARTSRRRVDMDGEEGGRVVTTDRPDGFTASRDVTAAASSGYVGGSAIGE